jgi:N-acetylglucosaminyldiphosphoundecaprenol N-acetyl-beta-D-mannosaminyltransferase
LSIETAFARVAVGGGSFHACTEGQVVTAVRESLDRGAGGRIITPNVDIVRQARRDPTVRAYLADASFVVADGMPLVWASRLAGTPLPERVCGSSLIWSLAAGLGHDGRSVYLLGGEPARTGLPGARRGGPPPSGSAVLRAGYAAGVADTATALDGRAVVRHDGAWRAAARLAAASPGLRVAGCHSPAYGFERRPETLAQVCGAVVEAKPDLVYVGIGFPKQEWLISKLRAELPFTWFLGCGAAINFVAGDQRRAPRWMQRTGLEWAHRLASEPRRLAGRYVRHDAPYALRLLAGACAARYRS